MARLRKGIAVCNACWMQLLLEGRFYCILAIISIAIFYMTEGICTYAAEHQYAIAPWLFPFLTCNREARLMLFSAALLMLCDIGSEKDTYTYQLLRCGRMSYVLGKIGYLFSLCGFYTLFMALIVVILRIPYIRFSSDWGKVIGGFSSTMQNKTQGIMGRDYITDQLTVSQGMLYAILLCWLTLFIVGMTMYLLSIMNVPTFAQLGAGCAFIVLDYAANSIGNRAPVIYYLSPLTWSNLARLRYKKFQNVPDYRLAFGMAVGLALILIIGCIIHVKRFYRRKG